MNKIYIFLCLVCISLTTYSQDYYWYRGKQIPLHRGTQFYILYEDKNKGAIDSIAIDGGMISDYNGKKIKWGIVSKNSIIDDNDVVYKTPSYLCFDTLQNMFVTHRFYVKLKRTNDYYLLEEYANLYQLEIEQDIDFPTWYIMRCALNSKYTALQLANTFYESGLFAATEPEFIHSMRVECVNDDKFNQQWNLENAETIWSSYSGININYCNARAISVGSSSVVIGVYDNGVDLTHPDINFHTFSYDANTDSSPSQIYPYGTYNRTHHGTGCAGIIGALSNNDIGVAGIASGCPIMPISIDYSNTPPLKIKHGFVVAADSGCSVISNSWVLGSYSPLIEEGISYALSHGRNGKGCVVVFAAGNNDNDTLKYPANYNDSVIAVGAISPCGERKSPSSCDGESWWGSNFGEKLDIVAPGVKIYTTDIVGIGGANSTDYNPNFNGTSAACPHVAAVAGLVLSVNPNLTQIEVSDILESTARKIGGYSYATHTDRPNGTWNNEMGYGLVDAYAAVIAAKGGFIQGPEQMCDTAKYYLIRPSQPGETVLWSIDNSQILYPTYSIVGSNNQDTVIIACNDETIPHRDRLIPPTGHTKYLHATITNSDTSITYSKVLLHTVSEVPTVSASNSNIGWLPRTQRTFTVTNCTTVPDSALKWTVRRIIPPRHPNYSPTVVTNYYYGRTLTYSAPTVPLTRVDTLDISVSNLAGECGVANSNTLRFILLPSLPLLNAYVEGELLNISITEENDNRQQVLAQLNDDSSYTLELWHSIYGCMRAQVVSGATERMSVSGLPSGIYVLLLKENGNIIAETKVQIP